MNRQTDLVQRYLGSRGTDWNLKLVVPCEYVDDGEEVVVTLGRRDGMGVRCTVACAAGYHARVVNERRGIDTWVNVTDCARLRSTE